MMADEVKESFLNLGRVKDTNPKDSLGIKKVPLHSVPCGPLMELGLAMMEGGRKYGSHNYRSIGVRASVYYDAAIRHLMDWWEGEDIDPDSKLHHVIKAIASLVVLRDSMLMDNLEDDRPIQYPNKLNIAELNKKAEEVIKLYPNCAAPFVHFKENVIIPDGKTIGQAKGSSLVRDDTDVYIKDCKDCEHQWTICWPCNVCFNANKWEKKSETPDTRPDFVGCYNCRNVSEPMYGPICESCYGSDNHSNWEAK